MQPTYVHANLNEVNPINNETVNKQFDNLYDIFSKTVCKHAPLRKASRKEKRLQTKPWLTTGLLNSIKYKNNLYVKLHTRFSEQAHHDYKLYRNTLNRTIKSAKETYYRRTFQANKNNSAKVWNLINDIVNLKPKKKNFPTELETHDGITQDPQQICNKLNDFFVNVGKNLADTFQTDDYNYNMHRSKVKNSCFFAPATSEEVASIIRNLQGKKATREQDVDTKFLKFSNLIISPILSNLFNSCIIQGKYPDALKIAEVVPIFKKNNPQQATNYRPISLLSPFNKILEKLIYNRIYSYLDKGDLLSRHQYGFRQNSSTVHSLCTIYDQLIKNADDGLYSCCIFLDLTKAFDTVDHAILLNKLDHFFGIRGLPLQLLENYLTNRKQYTKLSHYKSKLAKLTYGVPQGSSLGPLLFLLYVDDLPSASNFETTLFADDTYLMLADKNLANLERRVNEELQNIDHWLKINKLSLNRQKSHYMLINKRPSVSCTADLQLSLNSHVLKRQQTVKYLGIFVDENLNWSTHIHQLSLQLARYSGLFYRLRKLVPPDVIRMLYHSLVQSKVQYGIAVWGNAAKTRLQELNLRLNNIIRTITFSSKFCSVTPLYKKLKLLKLTDVYKLELAKIMYQLHGGKLPKSFYDRFAKINAVHNYSTRQTKNLVYFKPRVKKTIGKELILHRGSSLWKEIDNSIKNCSWFSFKKYYKNFLIDKY